MKIAAITSGAAVPLSALAQILPETVNTVASTTLQALSAVGVGLGVRAQIKQAKRESENASKPES